MAERIKARAFGKAEFCSRRWRRSLGGDQKSKGHPPTRSISQKKAAADARFSPSRAHWERRRAVFICFVGSASFW